MNFTSFDGDPAQLDLPIRLLDERSADIRGKLQMLQQLNAGGLTEHLRGMNGSSSPQHTREGAQQRNAVLTKSTERLRKNVERMRNNALVVPETEEAPIAMEKREKREDITVAVLASRTARIAVYEDLLASVPCIAQIRSFHIPETSSREALVHSTLPLLVRQNPQVVLIDVPPGLPVTLTGAAVFPSLLSLALPQCVSLCVVHGPQSDGQILLGAGAALILRPPLSEGALQRLFSNLSLQRLRKAGGQKAIQREKEAAALREERILQGEGTPMKGTVAEVVAVRSPPLRTPQPPTPLPPQEESRESVGSAVGMGVKMEMGLVGTPPVEKGKEKEKEVAGVKVEVEAVRPREAVGSTVRRASLPMPAPFPEEDPAIRPSEIQPGEEYRQLIDILRSYEKGVEESPVLKDITQKLLDFVHHHEVQQKSAMAVLSEEITQLRGELVRSEAQKDTLLTTLAEQGSF